MRDGCSLFVAYTVYVFHVVSIASKEETWLYETKKEEFVFLSYN